MNNETKLFLMLFLIVGIGFFSNKINITGDVHLVKQNIGEYPTELYLSSSPDNSNVYMSGAFVGRTPLTLTGLEPKEYNIVLKKIGYYDLKENVNLERGKTKELILNLRKIGEGTFLINSNVNNADVYINNELKGVTPLSVNLVDGTYDIKISKKDYIDFFTVKSIKSGQEEDLFVTLISEPHGNLYISSEPKNANIFIDGQYLGKTPSTITLRKSSYLASIEKEGYEDKKINIDIINNKRKELIFKLEPSLGTLFVGSDNLGASIYIDGKYKGITPKVITGLNYGVHSLKLSKEYYEDYFGTLDIKMLYPNSIYINLKRK